VSKRKTLIPVLAGIAGVAAVGTLAYVLTRRAEGGPARNAREGREGAEPASTRSPELRESMVVPRSAVPDPLEVDLDLDGIFRAAAESELDEATVRCDVKVPPLAGADDAEPPGPDDLGGYWLSRATQSERSFSESELQVDLENVADLRDDAEPDEYEYEYEDEVRAVADRARRA
jgi:hypothetical protein